jgi:hypothetical protein
MKTPASPYFSLPLSLLLAASQSSSVLSLSPWSVSLSQQNHDLTLTHASSSTTISSICSSVAYVTPTGESTTYSTCLDKNLYDVTMTKGSGDSGTVVTVSHVPLDGALDGALDAALDHPFDYASSPTPPMIEQSITLYDDYYTISVSIFSSETFKTNRILPLADSTVTVPVHNSDPRALLVPFDNDIISMYQSRSLSDLLDGLLPMASSYVTALYDNDGKAGVIMGSLEHTVWKTGVSLHADPAWFLDRTFGAKKVDLVCGVASLEETHDEIDHMPVSAKKTSSAADDAGLFKVASPTFFVAHAEDWRDGMELYARSQERAPAELPIVPPLVGWNSWGVDQFPTQLADATAASSTLADLPAFRNSDERVFIDYDAVNIELEEQIKLIPIADGNDQSVGVYQAPWSYFSDDLSGTVTCGGATYNVLDMVKKNANGEPIAVPDKNMPPTNAKNYAFDPTHPGVLCQATTYIQACVDAGVKLVKIDFINWGSMEGGSNADGTNYLHEIETGMAAYNYGMEKIATVAEAGNIFISLSMAPTFPNHFAHARRIGCDQMYGGVEFTMNQLAGGWWQKEMLLLDPDLVVFNRNLIEEFAPDFLKPFVNKFVMGSQSRVNKAVTHGGLFLAGDDFTNSTSVDMAREFLGNERVNELMWSMKGESFRPVKSAAKFLLAPAAFEWAREEDDSVFLAVFNYNGVEKQITVNVGDTLLARGEGCAFDGGVDVWTGEKWDGMTKAAKDTGVMVFDLDNASSALLKFSCL